MGKVWKVLSWGTDPSWSFSVYFVEGYESILLEYREDEN